MAYFDAHCDALMNAARGVPLGRNDTQFDYERAAKIGGTQILAIFPQDRERPRAGALSQLEAFRNSPPPPPNMRVILSLEGADAFEGKLSEAEFFFRSGVKSLGLTWNDGNAFASACRGGDYGLTEPGRELVSFWTGAGGVIDVSHAGDKTFADLCEEIDTPFIASHSCCRALCEHPRNLTDAQIRTLAERGGVLGINFYPAFLGGADISDVTRHIKHAVQIGGENAAGLGSDFCGIDETPAGLSGVEDLPRLIELIRREFSPRAADKIVFENFERLFTNEEYGVLQRRGGGAGVAENPA